jgi:hypothetical protein
MNNQYMIPANTKRSMLLFGLFEPIDMIIFGVGVVATLMLMFIVGTSTPMEIGIDLAPLLITVAMVAPVPNHRNVWTFTVNIYTYYANQRKYRWRGWCMLHGEDESNEK